MTSLGTSIPLLLARMLESVPDGNGEIQRDNMIPLLSVERQYLNLCLRRLAFLVIILPATMMSQTRRFDGLRIIILSK